jgi:hypothetical protein
MSAENTANSPGSVSARGGDLSPSVANTRYLVEPLLALGGEQGTLGQLGSEVVYPAVQGLDLQLVAVEENPVKCRRLPGTAGVKHVASSPACLLLHLGAGLFKIHTPSGQIADLQLRGSGTVTAVGVSANGGTFGLILEHEEWACFALSYRNGDGTYGAFHRSPELTTRPANITISEDGLAMCTSDQVANVWGRTKGAVLLEFEWSTDISCAAFFEHDDPSFAKDVEDRAGRILLGCADLLEVHRDGTLASAHPTGRVSSIVVLKNVVILSFGDKISVHDLDFTILTDMAVPCKSLIAWGAGQYMTYGQGLLQWREWNATPKRYGALRVRNVAVCDAHVVLAGAKLSVYRCSPDAVLEIELDIQVSLLDISGSGVLAILCGKSIEVRKGLTRRKVNAILASVPVKDSEKYCALRFSAQGGFLALAGEKIHLYSVTAGYTLSRVIDQCVQALDWSPCDRYLRYRTKGGCSVWDLELDAPSDYEDGWATATTALETNLASCFVGTSVAHAIQGGGFMLAGDDGDDLVVLEKGHTITALAASRNRLPSGEREPRVPSVSPARKPPSEALRVLVSVSSESTVIFWKCRLNPGFRPSFTPAMSPTDRSGRSVDM